MELTIDQRIIRLATLREGVCRRQDLLDAGVGDGPIGRRIRQGELELVGRGLYVVRSARTSRTDLHIGLAATMCSTQPEGGALSHWTAAGLHGFGVERRNAPDRRHHVVVRKGAGNKVIGFMVHETRLWFDDDIEVVGSLRLTTPERTICDLANLRRLSGLRHLIERQLVARTISGDDLIACHQRLSRRGRRGTRRLRLLLAEIIDDEPIPMSVLEMRLLNGLRTRGCLGVEAQFQPPWYDGRRGIVDAAEPIGRTIIEADGRTWHGTTQAFDEDRRRDRQAAAAGWVVLRVGWREIIRRPEATFSEIVEVIETRRRAAV